MTATLSRDFDELTLGDRFATRGRTVTESDVASFATLTGDMHPQHTDAVWAGKSPFGARIAHGMLVVSYMLGLLQFDPDRVIALRRIRQATFKRPVMIGDTIRGEGRVESLDKIDMSTGIVGIRVDVVNQRGRVAARIALDALWRRGDGQRPEAPVDAALDLVGIPL
jgi:3-hydroxybutyryl-CoA dehydratase